MSISRMSLSGLRVLLTRAEGDNADAWAAAFAKAGAIPLSYPTVTIVAPESWEDLDRALARLGDYDWLVLTSQTAVSMVLGRLPGRCFPAGLRAKIAAIGPKTAQAITEAGGDVTLLPADSRQEGLVESFPTLPVGTRILLPIAADGRSFLSETLRARGCIVDRIPVYQTMPKTALPPLPDFDIAAFASPSALRAFVASLGRQALVGKTVAVIGSTTAKEAFRQGIDPVVAKTPDVQALVFAIVQSFASQGDR
jgi:uroporphyrinogen-III synthase